MSIKAITAPQQARGAVIQPFLMAQKQRQQRTILSGISNVFCYLAHSRHITWEIPPGGVDSWERIFLLEALDVEFLIFFPAPDLAEPTAVPRGATYLPVF